MFPELCLTGYSIDDLLLQDAVLDGVEAAIATVVAGSAGLLPLLVVGAPLRHRNRVYNCAVGRPPRPPARRRAQVVPAHLPRVLRGPAARLGRRPSAARSASAGADVPFGPDLLFAADDVPGLVVHAEICEDVWVPVPPSAEAALAGATVLLNLSGSPITVGRAEDRKLLCRSASSRCLAAYAYAAAGQGESTTDLSWDGQTMIYESGALLAETERFPDGARRSVADVDLDLLAQERRRMGTFDDNRLQHADRTGAFRRIAFELDPPGGDLGLRRTVERFPFVPADAGAARPRLLRGVQHPGRGPPAAAGGDRRPEGRHRRVRRARLDARAARRRAGDGPGRAPAQRHPRLHAPRLRDERGHEAQRAPAHGAPSA